MKFCFLTVFLFVGTITAQDLQAQILMRSLPPGYESQRAKEPDEALPTLEDDIQASKSADKPSTPNSPDIADAKNDDLIIYGRRGCGFTQRFLKKFDTKKIKHEFVDIDESKGDKEFSRAMAKAGISGSIDLPVVVWKEKTMVRPELNKIVNMVPHETTTPNNIPNQKPVIMFSDKSSRFTRDYMEDLDDAGIKYTFVDVNSPEGNKEFNKKLTAAGFSGSINLPAVLVAQKVLIKPSVEATVNTLKK